jgi:pretoxin HINT domain-containing protein
VDARRAGAEAQRIANEGESAAANAARDAKSSGASESSGGGAPACHSFVAGTKVALADGSSKPIEQMQTGDVVESTDPATGQVESHKVVATIVHGDESERTELTVDAAGVAGTVVATDWHPVWVEEAGGFVDIGAVQVGDHLHSADGPAPVVTAVRHFSQVSPVYDLTVDDVHTYYVGASEAPILVHNCGEASLGAQADAGEMRGSDFAAEYESRSGHVYRSDNKESVTAPDEMAEIFEQQAHPMNGGCAEMQCLSKAYAREGEVGIRGGKMSTVHVSDTSKGSHGAPATPCRACRRVMGSLGVHY